MMVHQSKLFVKKVIDQAYKAGLALLELELT